MLNQRGYTVIEIMMVFIILFGGGGWIANIYKIVSTISDPVTGLFVFRCFGVVFAPLGAVLGYF